MRNHHDMQRQHPGRTHERGGFTLIELMVAVLVGSIVMMGVYTIYSVSVRGYRIQDQALEALSNLRSANQQLKSDLRSAAFNAPAQSNEEQWVTAVGITNVLSAVAIDTDPTTPVANPGVNANIAPQRVRLLGDYESHRLYRTVSIAGALVTFEWPGGSLQDFNRVFNDTNMLRIEKYGQAREEQIIPISDATFNGGFNPTVTLTQPVQNILGFGSGHEMTVVSYVRYRIVEDTKRSTSGVKYDLVREKLDPEGLAIPGTWLTVGEYVVDLQFYDICFNVQAFQVGTMIQRPLDIECYPNLAALTAAGFSLQPNGSNQSHLLRSLKFKLATRTAFEDPDQQLIARGDVNDPLRAMDLDTTLRGAAKVFEGAGTVFMTSIQARRQ